LLALLLAVAAALSVLAYRDFFGPMERFHAVVRKVDPTTHYNNGVAYKNRGMWYMATREWEEAVARMPRDINYLRALGLAYAQIGRYEPAREMLDRALKLAPNHAQLSEDRALVERLAARR
jgi:tetratricopeptide (TPR) repeat protein